MAVRTKKFGKIEYLAAEGISVPHCFTTRIGGVSEGIYASMNIGMHRGDSAEKVAENHRLLAQALGYEVNKIVMTRQIHSDIVRVVTEKDCAGIDHHQYPYCDALVTNTPDVALVIFTADCTPILLHDPEIGAVGAVHAGWRGTAANIAGKAVATMAREFGCKPENIRAAIGPNIGGCCFETDAEVPNAMVQAFGSAVEKWIESKNEKFYVNLKEINRHALLDAGVRHIEVSDGCTVCQSGRFWSHRVTHGNRGSQGGVIVCKEKRL